MENKQFVVIGLGRFGYSVATTLFELGNDVLAIDKNEDIVQEISDEVTHAVVMDATDECALKKLGIRNFDVAVVTIGDDIQSSIMITLLLRELGVKYIIAKGHNDLHEKVLKKIGADKVVLPEKDMGKRVAHNLVSSNILDYIELSKDYTIIEIEAIDEWKNKSLLELNFRSKYRINVMAIKRNGSINISPMADEKIMENDILVAIGSNKDINKLEVLMAKSK